MSKYKDFIDVYFNAKTSEDDMRRQTKKSRSENKKSGVKFAEKSEWEKMFGLYQTINEEMRQRKKIFTKEDVERLKVTTDELYLLYFQFFPGKVSIYFKLLFQGVFFQQLLHFGNLAIYDQESAEANQKVTKIHIRANTNQQDPSADLILIYAVKFIFLTETFNTKYPDSAQFKNRFQETASLPPTDKKRILELDEETLMEKAMDDIDTAQNTLINEQLNGDTAVPENDLDDDIAARVDNDDDLDNLF